MRIFISTVFIYGLQFTAALAGGDAAAGAAVFKKCAACHALGENATNKVGPVLNGLIGRTAGTFAGYNYSQAMKDAGTGGLVWAEDQLAVYLKNPKELVKGNKMSFSGLKKEEEIQDIIAYLKTFSSVQ